MNKQILALGLCGLLGFGWLCADEHQQAAKEMAAQEKMTTHARAKQIYDEYTNGKWQAFLEENGEAAKALRESGESITPPSLRDLSESELKEVQDLSDKLWNLTESTALKVVEICQQDGASKDACAIAAQWNKPYLEKVNHGRQLNNAIMVWMHGQKEEPATKDLDALMLDHIDRSMVVVHGADSNMQIQERAIVLGYWMLDKLANTAKEHNQEEMSSKIRNGTQDFGAYIAFNVDWVMLMEGLNEEAEPESETATKLYKAVSDHLQKAQTLVGGAANEREPVEAPQPKDEGSQE